jgi:hypothetical protein
MQPLRSWAKWLGRYIWTKVANYVKQQCVSIVAGLIKKLEKCFLLQELLNATKVICLQQ